MASTEGASWRARRAAAMPASLNARASSIGWASGVAGEAADGTVEFVIWINMD